MRTRHLLSTLALALLLALPACESSGGGDDPIDTSGDRQDVIQLADTGESRDTTTPDDDVAKSVGCGPSLQTVDSDWHRQAVFYEVFVRSFYDADGDGVGDLTGLIEKLDYLNDGDPTTDTDLGVTALWLMPVTESSSYHGYDTVDYRAVEMDYGTMGDLETLIRLAHQREMKVILDLVLNHTGSQHPWFTDPTLAEDRYIWADEDPGWSQPTGTPGDAWHERGGRYYYAAFSPGMPDLDYTNPTVREEMLDIARFWLDKGIDGFRLDAVRFLIETGETPGQADTDETHEFWSWFRAELEADYPDALLLGEAWADRARVLPYYGENAGDELHMAFDFDLQEALEDGLIASDPTDVRDTLCSVVRTFPAHAQDATFLSNHDMTRVATRVRRDAAKLRLAAGLLLTLPGTPFLYYGEEIGVPNGSTQMDEDKRLPMRWDDSEQAGFTTGEPWRAPWTGDDAPDVASQTDDEASLLTLYRQLIRLRRGHTALLAGQTEVVPTDSQSDPALLAFLRADVDECLLVVHNFGEETLEAPTVDLAGLLLGAGSERADLLWSETDGETTREGDLVSLPDLAPHSSAVLTLRSAR